MEDVVELGPPDRPPRRGWVVGVAALLVLGAVAAGATRVDRDRPAAGAAPTPTPAVAPYSPAPTSFPQPNDVPTDVDPLSGDWTLPRATERTGLAVAGPSDALRVMDLDSGRVRTTRLPGASGVTTVRPIAPVDGGWLVLDYTFCEQVCEGRLYVVRGGRATFVTRAASATPDGDGRTVWTTHVTDPKGDFEDPQRLERWTFGGTRLRGRIMLASGEAVLGVTPDGPVVGEPGGHGTAFLVDARTLVKRAVMEGRQVLGVAGYDVAALAESCADDFTDCALYVMNVRTGVERRVAALGNTVARGTIDPTGRYVAVGFQHGDAAVRVFDVAAAREIEIAGLTLPPMATTLRWSPDGRWLLAAHSVENVTAPANEIAVWRPGLATALRMKTYTGSGAWEIAVGNVR